MLGPPQERWLLNNLGRSDARWNIIGNQVLIAELDHDGHARGDDLFWNDSWDGYPEARTRITKFIEDARVRNPAVITGDWHSRVNRRILEVDWRIADRVGDPNAPVRTLRTFAVESGRPGIAQA